MPDSANEPEHIIAAAIERHAEGDPAALACAILAELWEAGYDVRLRPDEPRPYYATAAELRAIDEGLAGPAVSAEKAGELFRQPAQEPHNEPIRDKIRDRPG